MELWVDLEGGTRTRHTVTLREPVTEVLLPTAGQPVRALRPNPRQDTLLNSRSAQRGDVNFDLDVDGSDLIACAWLAGKRVAAPFVIGESLTGVDLDFDPQCDLNGDGAITTEDLQALEQLFGQSRRP